MSTISFVKQRGTSLLEVLIAAIIVAIGLLGIAALQMKAVQYSVDSQYRSVATDIAWSMADRIRANLAEDNSYSNIAANCSAVVKKCAMVPTASDATSTDSCSATEIAAYDIKSVLCTIGGLPELPGGTLSVLTCADADATDTDDCSPHSTFEIQVGWSTRSNFDGDFEDSVVMVIVPGTEQTTPL
ncbi:MAG: type IV pilus modification protein PilV [Xanthomonadales bacterium]|nr:type IV pilus modification protein PilV [Xanthomonadales bacterium]